MDTKRIVLLALISLTLSVAACRQEVSYAPLKLGGPLPSADQPIR